MATYCGGYHGNIFWCLPWEHILVVSGYYGNILWLLPWEQIVVVTMGTYCVDDTILNAA